jgi:Fur family peroxide stress response transcriptional regulator
MNKRHEPKAVSDEALLAQRLAAFRRSLRESGVRLTPQRLEVFREVAGRGDHPDAETVFREVRRRMPAVSRDTVHRTLQLLKDLGLVVPLGPRHESVRFDAHVEPHDHYVCLRCGMTRDIEGIRADVRPKPQLVAHLGSVVRARVEVQGICRACAEEVKGVVGKTERKGAT